MKRFLHVGCGRARKDAVPVAQFQDWKEVTLDIDPDANADYCFDAASPGYHERGLDGAFDGVFSSHMLEHLDEAQVGVALKNFATWLAPQGIAIIIVPNGQYAAEAFAQLGNRKLWNAPCGPVTPLDVLFGHREMASRNPHMRHRTAFTADILHGQMAAAFGVATILDVDQQNIIAKGIRL